MSPTPAELIGSLISAAAPAVSPDGTQVVFVVKRVDLEDNGYRTQLWIAPTDGSARARPLTSGRKDANPVWSPDGSALAFTSARGAAGHTTLHVMPMDGPGETSTIAERDEAVVDPAWSPDGRWLVFASRCRSERYEETDPAKQAPRRITRFMSRLDGAGWVHDRPSHLFVVPADGTASPRDLTPGEFAYDHPAWLPDSSGVIASGGAHESWDLDLAVDLHHVPLQGAARPLTLRTGAYQFPAVSPDGRQVAFLGCDDPETYPQNVRVGVLDLDTDARRWVSEGLDRTFVPTAGCRAPVWTEAGLLAAAEDRGDALVFLVDPSGATAPVAVTPAGGVVSAFSYAAGTLAVAGARVDRPSEIGCLSGVGLATRPSPDPVGVRVVSSVTDRLVATTAPRSATRFAAPSTGGAEVDTWVFTPADYDDTGSFPVLLNVHGGPFTQYGNTYFDEAQIQAAAGYVVVMSNPRGSSGRDEPWGQAIMGPTHQARPGTGWGSVDVDDILAALDEALRRFPGADPERVGMLGGSYGGFMATWLAAHHGARFRAICSERAVNNLLSEEWNSDIATMFRVEHGATHLQAPDEYLRMSPITYVNQIHVPLLIVHSEDDLRCPITQADELFVALRLLGREVEFVRFPAEGHELSRSGSPRHRVQRAELILEFFARHLG